MAAHSHPRGFEFSGVMGVFQTVFLNFGKNRQTNKQNHPILVDPAPAFGCAVSAWFCSAAEETHPGGTTQSQKTNEKSP